MSCEDLGAVFAGALREVVEVDIVDVEAFAGSYVAEVDPTTDPWAHCAPAF